MMTVKISAKCRSARGHPDPAVNRTDRLHRAASSDMMAVTTRLGQRKAARH